jgi:Tfp pilus assembly protein PilV
MNRIEKGFTYVETLLSMFILGIGCLGLAQLFLVGIQTNVRTKDDTEIATTAQRYLERLYQQGYNQLASLQLLLRIFQCLEFSWKTVPQSQILHNFTKMR